MQGPSQILSAIPDGGSISFTAFAQQVGSFANFFSFASPQTLSRSGSHVTINCSGSGTLKNSSGVTIDTDPVIQMDVAVGANNVVSLTNIKGIKVKDGIIGGTLTQATITPLSNGDFQFDGSVDTGFPLGTVSFSKTIDQNGNII